MATKDELKKRICESVDRRRAQIEGIGDHIMANPELGFKEFETAKLVTETMEEFRFTPQPGLAKNRCQCHAEGEETGADRGPDRGARLPGRGGSPDGESGNGRCARLRP